MTIMKDIKAKRLDEMENYILERGSANFRQLEENFGISTNTLRHDIAELCMRGTVKKVYGGVVSTATRVVTSVAERRYQNYGLKMRIGEVAGKLVEDGTSIFIDAGTTAECMVPYLANVSDVKVTSHCLAVIEKACNLSNLNLLCIGGSYSFLTRSFMDYEGIEKIGSDKYDQVFIGASSVMPDGVYVDLYIVSVMKENIIKAGAGGKVVVLTDSTKYLKPAPFKAFDLDRIAILVSDKEPPGKLREALEKNNVKFLLA